MHCVDYEVRCSAQDGCLASRLVLVVAAASQTQSGPVRARAKPDAFGAAAASNRRFTSRSAPLLLRCVLLTHLKYAPPTELAQPAALATCPCHHHACPDETALLFRHIWQSILLRLVPRRQMGHWYVPASPSSVVSPLTLNSMGSDRRRVSTGFDFGACACSTSSSVYFDRYASPQNLGYYPPNSTTYASAPAYAPPAPQPYAYPPPPGPPPLPMLCPRRTSLASFFYLNRLNSNRPFHCSQKVQSSQQFISRILIQSSHLNLGNQLFDSNLERFVRS